MIVSRTPLRISFCGGGSDFPKWYTGRYGCVVGAAIDKHIYVMVSKRFEGGVRVAYTQTEIVDDFEDLQHDLIRECMRLTGVTKDVEIVTISDVPGKGTGLGSSSAVTVGVLNALWNYTDGHGPNAAELADEACEIELDILGKPIGKQDQYLCALGGVNCIEFLGDGQVVPEKIWHMRAGRDNWCDFSDRLLLFYLGTTRDANEILKVQDGRTKENEKLLQSMADAARKARNALLTGEFRTIGELMSFTWQLKRNLASGVSTRDIDCIYHRAYKRAGALGGKVCGAGGGGFMLLYVEPENQAGVREALSDLKELEFKFDYEGAKIIYAD